MNPYLIGVGIGILILLFSSGVSMLSGSTTYDHWFQQYAPTGVSWTVLKKICYIESSLGENSRVKRGLENPSDVAGSTSYDGLSWGIMQLRPSTAQQFDSTATAVKLNNPEYSIKIAAKYIAWCRSYLLQNTKIKESDPRFMEFLIKSYNQGVGNTAKEINGSGKNYAGAYWDKFQDALT